MSGSELDSAIAAVIDRAVALGRVVSRGQLGLDEAHVAEVERDAGRRLPLVYRSFLRQCGAGLGTVGTGSVLFYPEILGIRAAVDELLADNGLSLGAGDIPFHMHQGYFAAWLHGDGDDPEVVSYLEGDPAPRIAAPDFVTWLAEFALTG